MDFRYTRPPPPLTPDPNHHQQPPRQPFPPPPGPGPWFSGQFQYNPAPHPQQHSDHLPPPPYDATVAPPPPPPPSHLPPYNYQYSRAQMPPPHPYPPVNQEWGNPNWGHQGWDYPVHNNEDDWAAKARVWVASKAVTDNQHQQAQFAPIGRQEEINHYPYQYSQNVDPHYSDVQQHSLPVSNYQQYTPPAAPSHMTPAGHTQDQSSFSSGYAQDGNFPYTAGDGSGDSTIAYRHQESTFTSLSFHQQEVSSSYSSVTGRESGEQNGSFYSSSHVPFASVPNHQVQPSLPHSDRQISKEQPHYSFSNQSTEPTIDISDQPLDFVSRFSRDHEAFGHSKYATESGGSLRDMETASAMPSIHSWSSSPPPGVVYPSVPSLHPSGAQVDPSLAVHSPVPSHLAPLFGRISGSGFQSTIPPASASFPMGTANTFHAATTFPSDTFGTPGFPDHPKKASVPNWLREEIIKKKAVIEASVPGISKEVLESNEVETADKSDGVGDRADGKSVESSRSTEEEDDDEDYVDAARTAAINQEIKRVLTEVLLKVTDELFDEIATKVLDEDDHLVGVERDADAVNHTILPSTPAVPTPKSSAKVLIPAKMKETDLDDASAKSTSASHGDVLGLASYASDEDEDEVVQNSAMPSSKASNLAPKNILEGKKLAENGSLQADNDVHGNILVDEKKDNHRMNQNGATGDHSIVGSELSHNVVGIEPVHSSFKAEYLAMENKRVSSQNEKELDGDDILKAKHNVGERGVGGTALPIESLNSKKSVTDSSQGSTHRDGSDRRDSGHGKVDESSRSLDERHTKKSKKDDRNGSKEKLKEREVIDREKAKESDLGRRVSSANIKEDKKETERDRRSHNKEDDSKRGRTKDEKGERSRHKLGSDSSRHKRRRSSSIGSRGGRSSKENAGHDNGSSDRSSDDSRRKVHSKRHNLSPSPVRSRKRQVSRSPHSKHSQHRHSPYSSLESTRERRRG